MRLPRTLLLGALLGATACSASASNLRPTVSVPAQFSPGGTQQLADKWWLAFGDPALDRLVEQSLQSNPGLLATWARLDQADASAQRSGAQLYPSLSASASAGVRTRQADAAHPSLSLGLAASYEVDLWGRIGATHDAALLDARASEMDLRAAAISLTAAIADSWYELGARRAEHQLLETQRTLAEHSLDLTRQRFDHGLVASVDVLRQEQNVESIGGSLAQSEQASALLEHQLAVLLGRAPTDQVVATTPVLVSLPELPALGVPAELIQRRPDVVASWLRVQAADKGMAAAIAARYPRLNLTAGVSSAASSPQAMLVNWASSLVAGLVAPLLDAGEGQAEVARSRAALAERVQGYAETVLTALQDIEDPLVSEQKQREQLTSLQRQLELATEALARIQEGYAAGMRDYFEVLSATESVQSLERQQLQMQLQLIQTRIALCRALSGSWTLARPEAARS
jgi:NodT family efflux transporter outer membrane factor (OMF) lipoprotein